MNESQSPLSHYLRILKRQAWLVVLLLVLTLGVTSILVFTKEKEYRATMKIVVAQSGGDSQPDLGSQQLSQTMKTLIESDVVARRVIRNAGLDTTPPKLLKKVHVTFRPDSSVLDVSYDSTSKEQAKAVVNEYREVFGDLVDEKGTLPGIVVSVFDPPHVQPDPVSPKPAKTLGFAAAIAIALGLMLAFARESLDDRIRSRRDAEEWFGAPVVGTLPKKARGTRPAGVAGSQESEGLLAALNLLRVNLEFSPGGVAGPTILITSALSGEGKTTVAGNLGSVLAMGGHRVICVEADLRRPALRGYMGVPPQAEGLLEVLNGEAEVDAALQTIELVGPSTNPAGPRRLGLGRKNGARPSGEVTPLISGELRILPVGNVPGHIGMAFTAEKVAPLIEKLRDRADFIIIDSSPLLTLADSLLLAQHSDDVLVVARQGQTKKDKAEAVRARLHVLGIERIGVVLTDSPPPESGGYYQ